MLVARKRIALSLFVTMLLVTLGSDVSAVFLESTGVLSLVWPMTMLLLATYWLRLFLSDWMRQVQLGMPGDESVKPCFRHIK